MIEGHCRGLSEKGIPFLVLCGQVPEECSINPVMMDPGLDYQDQIQSDLTGRLKQVVIDRFGNERVVWHFHNPCLGKNPALTRSVTELAGQGEALILHHHDFAEEGRPENYEKLRALKLIYPRAPHLIHACINSRDLEILRRAGLPDSESVVIPNPLSLPKVTRKEPRWVFQPVRGIRRKNLGETLLIAAHAPQGTRFAISRRPDQAHSIPTHKAWEDLALELSLPIEFGVTDRLPPAPGETSTFGSWLAHSHHLLSTSVQEGFGMTFLEGAALEIPVIGRRLTEIGDGLPADSQGLLYDRIMVPENLLDWKDLERRRRDGVQSMYHRYRVNPPSSALSSEETEVDFGMLPEDIQASVIRQSTRTGTIIVAETPEGRIPLAEHIRRALQLRQANRPDLRHHELPAVVRELERLREQLLEATPSTPEPLNQDSILQAFLERARPDFGIK